MVIIAFCGWVNGVFSQGVPDLLYYKFDVKGKKVVNLAKSKPSGTDTAYLNGSLSIGDTGLCGKALVGSGVSASTDYLNTGWATSLSGSWTISFWTKKFGVPTTLYYIFGDASASSFRCFTNGVAGSNNWILRGPLTDVTIYGGATASPNQITFVYNDTTKYIYGYINGLLVTSTPQTTSPVISGSGPFKVMGYSANIGAPVGGLIDNFMIYSKALTAAQVAEISSAKSFTKTAVNACSSFTSASGKYKYTKSGVYKDTVVGFLGCDSIIEYTLTILPKSADTISVTRCGSYKSPSGKHTWYKSGTFIDTLVNYRGCDSLLTVELTINEPTVYQQQITACSYWISPMQKIHWNSGSYVDTLMNVAGCDSFLYTQLTINQPTSMQIKVTVCGSYTSPAGHLYTQSANFSDTIKNSVGCDSIVYVNLTVNTISKEIVDVKACDVYVSPLGNLHYQSGTYFDTLKGYYGCDSIIQTNLIVTKSSRVKYVVSACRFFENHKGVTLTKSGYYVDSMKTINGCDSIIELELTIDTLNIAVSGNNNVLTASPANAQYQWLDCNNAYSPINNEIQQSFAPSANGQYAVQVILNSCIDTSDCFTIQNISSKGLKQSNFNVYPNPSQGIYTVNAGDKAIGKLRILGLNGQILKNLDLSNQSHYQLSLMDYAAGIYTLEVDQNGKISTMKLVKLESQK